MKLAGALLAVVALGAAVYWLVGRDERAPVSLAPEEAAPAERAGSPERELAEVREPASAAEPQTAEPEGVAEAPQRSAAAVAAEPGETAVVRVVDRASGAPVAGAAVFVLDPRAVPQDQAMREATADGGFDRLVERHGERRTTDSQGEATVPAAALFSVVTAREGERWGMGQLERGATELVLELAPVTAVRIRVVDARSQPVADVPVSVRVHTGDWAHDAWGSRTNAEGLAEIRHADRMLEGMGERDRVSAALAFPLAEPVETPIDLAAPPAEPVELVLPLTGSARVRVRGGGDEGVIVALGVPPDPGRQRNTGTGASVIVEDGVARFPFVGLGLELEASVGRMGQGGMLMHGFTGPVAAGHEVETVVDLGQAPYVVGLVVDEKGKAVANGRFVVDLSTRSASESTTITNWIPTDAEGRFRYDLDPHLPADAELELRLRAEHALRAGGAAKEARASVPVPLPPGPTDLGRLVLAMPSLVVSGRVVDSAGRPIQEAAVLVGAVSASAPEGFQGWSTLPDLSDESDARGRFEIRGGTPAGARLVLTAFRDGYTSPEAGVPFTFGAQGVELVLQRGAAVEGSVLVDAGIPREAIAVAVREEGGVLHQVPVAGDGSFAFTMLDAGRLRFSAGVESAPKLVVVEGLEVGVGETCRDPRLQEIDLRGRLTGFTLSVVRPDGELARDGYVTLATRDARHSAPGARWRLDGDPLYVVAPRGGLDLLVVVPGYREVELPGVASDQRVDLEPGPHIRLRVAGVPLPEPPLYLAVRLRHDAGASPLGDPLEIGLDGVLETSVGAPGEYVVHWTVVDRTGSSSRSGSVFTKVPRITVTADPAAQEFELHLDPADLQDALDRLR